MNVELDLAGGDKTVITLQLRMSSDEATDFSIIFLSCLNPPAFHCSFLDNYFSERTVQAAHIYDVYAGIERCRL